MNTGQRLPAYFQFFFGLLQLQLDHIHSSVLLFLARRQLSFALLLYQPRRRELENTNIPFCKDVDALPLNRGVPRPPTSAVPRHAASENRQTNVTSSTEVT